MNELAFSLAHCLKLPFTLEEALYGLDPEMLFGLALRQNEKRPFLFVSKVLGKHIPLNPLALLAAGKLLALAAVDAPDGERYTAVLQGRETPTFACFSQELKREQHVLSPAERTLFIGFAETATGLARAVADCFTGELRYVSTTRASLPGSVPLTFDEAHSHARTHLLHVEREDSFLKSCVRAVLVDDEFTTGRTALHLVEALHGVYGIRDFLLLTLLDNSGAEERKALEKRLGIRVQVRALLRGHIGAAEIGEAPVCALEDYREASEEPRWLQSGLAFGDDRKPISPEDMERQRKQCAMLAAQFASGAEALWLGAGECIYLPALIAGFAGGRAFHSTTQSPVFPLPDSAIASGVCVTPPDNYSAAGYLYNVPQNHYSHAVLCAEEKWLCKDGLRQITAYLKHRGISQVEVAVL